MTGWTDPPATETIVIGDGVLRATILPRKGGDIYSIVDRATGIDVLFKTPWGWQDPERVAGQVGSEQAWLARYPGGWQQLVPNAGPERMIDGITRGYHGEAALLPWRLIERTARSVALEVRLTTAPLLLQREVVMTDGVMQVTDSIRNLADVPVPVCWVEHPAFGAPFIDEHCFVQSGARSVVAQTANRPSDISKVPARGSMAATFFALTDFGDPWYAITSPSCGFGIGVAWDGDVLPHAWYWQEAGGTEGYPWYGQAYVAAIEPANVLPGSVEIPVLEPGSLWTARVAVCRFEVIGSVKRVGINGTVEFEE